MEGAQRKTDILRMDRQRAMRIVGRSTANKEGEKSMMRETVNTSIEN